MTDRAGVATAAILQIVRMGLLLWIDGGRPDMTSVRAEIQNLLRDEFADVARVTVSEIRESE